MLLLYMLRTRASDLAMGLANETKLIGLLKYNFCMLYNEADLINTKDIYNQYHKYDWEGSTNGTHFEMKSRRNRKLTYPTTIIPVDKIRPTENKQVFIFHFTDATCYIEYNKEIFDKFATSMRTTERDGRWDKPKLHYDIPVGLLIDLDELAI